MSKKYENKMKRISIITCLLVKVTSALVLLFRDIDTFCISLTAAGWWSILTESRLSTCWSPQQVQHVQNQLQEFPFFSHTTVVSCPASQYLDCLSSCCVSSGGHSEELHGRLWQNSHFQQDSPWIKSVLQRAHTTGGLHRALWFVSTWRLKSTGSYHVMCNL